MLFKSRIYLEYNDIISMCDNITYEVSKMKPDLIVGITRGGLLPALHMSHKLDRPMTTVRWQTRDRKQKEQIPYLQDMIKSDKTVVFVDDINDTGRTFKELNEAYKCEGTNTHFISLVKKIETKFDAHASLTLEDKRWIVFPWEKD